MTDLERALNENRAPWKEIEYRTRQFWVFRDAYPVTPGHLLFVPTSESSDALYECYRGAYRFGYEGVINGHWDAFNIGQNCGEAAGQTIMYPHVHMIPRRHGDTDDPRGGVRHVIPTKGNYVVEEFQESVNY
jgi:diadenosine tetraphosphate (Ap4A) HIT family hydrolase